MNLLKDPNMRIKTPGDLPPSVRKVRGGRAQSTARFSLYDDRIMCNIITDEEQPAERLASTSVPFGIDLDESILKATTVKYDANDVTCF